jgi:hypothetical protein
MRAFKKAAHSFGFAAQSPTAASATVMGTHPMRLGTKRSTPNGVMAIFDSLAVGSACLRLAQRHDPNEISSTGISMAVRVSVSKVF